MTLTSYGSNLEFLSRSNTSSCAQACANNAECDAFSVDKRDGCRQRRQRIFKYTKQKKNIYKYDKRETYLQASKVRQTTKGQERNCWILSQE